jgi:ParB family transcriptional regulator, chromosome partitioning protein
MTNFIKEYPLADLHPADYNPRIITDNGFETLKYSIQKFGVVKPVIINGEKGILTAGHQRTKACKAVGLTHVPAMRLKDVSQQDEVAFNLMHNRIEENTCIAEIKGNFNYGYSIVKPNEILLDNSNKNAAIRHSIGKLLAKYGEWGSVVIDENNQVIANSEYAAMIKQMNMNLLVYKLPQIYVPEFIELMGKDYGEYHYQNLAKPYNQTFCQMHRLTGGERGNNSTTYEYLVLPNCEQELMEGKRIFDFGAGEQGYIKMLQGKGYNAFAYEPYPRVKGKHSLDINAVIKMIKAAARDIEKNGLYDFVVLDSVINSVTNLQYQRYVLTVCNALLKPEGTFFMGTRKMEKVTAQENVKTAESQNRYIEFLDKDMFTGTFQQGVWTMQKLHTKDTLQKLLLGYFGKVAISTLHGSSMHHAYCKSPINLPHKDYFAALETEFNMEYPNGFKHQQHKEIVKLLYKLVCNR